MPKKNSPGLSIFQKILFGILTGLSIFPVFNHLRNSVIVNYLRKRYFHLLSQEEDKNVIGNDYKTFVFWWDGINETTPVIIKTTINSIKRNGKNVILITKNNYLSYVDIPDSIISKFKNGIIDLTHFSDILRCALLYKYGGLWIDATVYLNQPFDDITKYHFYSPKQKSTFANRVLVHRGKWFIYFMAASKNSVIMRNCLNLHYSYWEEHDHLICYFLLDYTIEIQYRYLQNIKSIIDKIPLNNKYVHKFCVVPFDLKFNHKYDDKKFKKYSADTKAFKLTYKYNHKYDSLNNTYLQHFIDNEKST
ncbi:MAG: capsular polysaccharide synthesis protein [Bacilli bacterium]|nr:capsular polysaccharide synthesis protein [Bacilli bacterium]